MRSLLLLIFIFAVSEESDVPTGCYTVVHDMYEECFTFNNTVYATQPTARSACASSGGQLAVVKDERTWNLLIDKFLTGFADNIWLGYQCDSHTTKLIPELDLKNLSNYWLPNLRSSYYTDRCMYAQKYTWKWQLEDYLSCNVNDVYQPHVSRCMGANYIRHDETVQLQCDNGYFLNNTKPIKCHRGNLTEIPHCVHGCPSPGQRHYAVLTSVKEYYNIGETAYYVCENNHFNRQNHQLTHFAISCQSDSTWSEDAGCGEKHPFSTITINIPPVDDSSTYFNTTNPLSNVNDIELKCDLIASEKSWLHNGKFISSVNTDGTLTVDLRSGDDFSGFYICVGKLNDRVQFGSKAYTLIERKQCQMNQKTMVETTENKHLLLVCPHESNDHLVKWFKDDEEIFSNENQNFISNTGLFLQNVTLKHEGIYKCQITEKENHTYCTRNITHKVSVIASADSVCGVVGGSGKKYQPWLAVLRHNDEVVPFCYGTLINNKWVVTSAFCLAPLQRRKVLDGFVVQFGSASNQNTFPVATVKIHPLYRTRRTPYDVGLIQLANSPNKFSNNYLPACISPEDIGNIHKCEQVADLNGTVAGWGSLMGEVDENGLEVEEMSLVSKEICRNSKTMGFAEDKFCAKFSGKLESFAGDSGSPFFINHKGRNYLLGIYTWGERETLTGNYDYFTGIYQYYDWIKKITA